MKITRKNVFAAAIVSFLLSWVAYETRSTYSPLIVDLAYYASIAFGLTWIAMMVTGKGKGK